MCGWLEEQQKKMWEMATTDFEPRNGSEGEEDVES